MSEAGGELEALAMIQELDTRLDQLTHRRAHLLEHAQLESLDREQLEIDEASLTLSASRHELERDQKRFEDEVASIEAKKQSDNDRMYNTGITSPKDLSALQEELQSLARRQEIIEDQVLDLMEQIEPLSSSIGSFESRLGEIDAERSTLSAAIAVAEAEIDAEVAELGTKRDTHAGQLTDELTSRYEGLRSRSRDGIVIGRVSDGNCSACGLRLASGFLDEAKHSDHSELMQCEECGVLLVT